MVSMQSHDRLVRSGLPRGDWTMNHVAGGGSSSQRLVAAACSSNIEQPGTTEITKSKETLSHDVELSFGYADDDHPQWLSIDSADMLSLARLDLPEVMVRKVEMQHHMHGNFEKPINHSPSTMVSHRMTQRVSWLHEITFVGTNMAPGSVHHPGPTAFHAGEIQRSSCSAAHTGHVDWRMTQTIEGSLRQIMAECPTLTSAERTQTVRRNHNCPTSDSTAKLLTWKPGNSTTESRISKRMLELPNYRAIPRVDKRRQAVPIPQVAILVPKDKEESSNAAKQLPVMSNCTGNSLTIPWILRSKFLEAARTMLRDVAAPEPITKQRSYDYNGHPAFPASPKHYATFEPIGEKERSRLKKLKTELQALLVKVGSGYKKYRECLETLRNNFHARGGQDSAFTYTSLSLQAISRNFRTMKDPVVGILRICSEALREDLSRDHPEKPNERRQHLHRTVSSRRPAQRGQLPERAVAILRRWMFEHFLNPYPALEDKCLLARKTGLTRQKVSNWFINARVRLWKPMVKELYEDEFVPRSETDETDGPIEQQSDKRSEQILNRDHCGDDESTKGAGLELGACWLHTEQKPSSSEPDGSRDLSDGAFAVSGLLLSSSSSLIEIQRP